ncbi:MAG: hypothetical protein JNM59_11530 [Hyphomonadaceae bacterium]|nr:hypothetical protein [Hyphomonadaceae bacterium]
MRLLASTLAFALALASAAEAQDALDARAAYVERRGLLAADAHCHVLAPSLRGAIEVGALQTRGALLRAGWTSAQTNALEEATVAAARARACDDPRTASAVAQARASFGQWANAGSMAFPGWERTWTARRATIGWRLRQDVSAPRPATFGVRQSESGRQSLILALPVPRSAPPPSSVRLVMRDRARAPARDISLTTRIANGLAAGAPSPTTSRSYNGVYSSERNNGGATAVFTFPDAAFGQMLALDPRESVELRLERGRASERIFVEVGDIAAARAFLTLDR